MNKMAKILHKWPKSYLYGDNPTFMAKYIVEKIEKAKMDF